MNLRQNLISALLVLAILLLVKLCGITGWWLFILPIMLLGALLKYKKWKVNFFLVGFIVGFLIWSLAYCYYHSKTQSPILNRGDAIPLQLIIVLTGAIGGLLTGMAFFTGSYAISNHDQEIFEL